jgi:deoxyribodipyrimidine photo-lyase
MRGSMRQEFDELAWENDPAKFEAWKAGQTGYPIVDAAMRCLNSTGWMHNRLRMIVAMFLTKDLLVSWQWGERYFMQQLVDGDMAANNGGWQWSAGTGADAAPYFRIFNPVAQSLRFDPDAEFIKRWIPELASVPTVVCHEPWRDPAGTESYSQRIIQHEEARKKCLLMYSGVKRKRASQQA